MSQFQSFNGRVRCEYATFAMLDQCSSLAEAVIAQMTRNFVTIVRFIVQALATMRLTPFVLIHRCSCD